MALPDDLATTAALGSLMCFAANETGAAGARFL
jgi:hypothetical protein